MSEPKMPRTIAVDFDNTLFETDWPEIGNPIWPVINAAKTAKEEGAELILWTTREGKPLEDAIIACNKVGLTFDAININTAEMKKLWGYDPRKVGATEYWDDRAMKLTGYIPRPASGTITADKLGAPPASKIAPRRKDDSVSHPEHYTQGAIECIDAIRANGDKLGLRPDIRQTSVLSLGPTKTPSTPSTAAISAAASTPAAVSIWTKSETAASASARYPSTRFHRAERASADPTPRVPRGG